VIAKKRKSSSAKVSQWPSKLTLFTTYSLDSSIGLRAATEPAGQRMRFFHGDTHAVNIIKGGVSLTLPLKSVINHQIIFCKENMHLFTVITSSYEKNIMHLFHGESVML
jgi:hypothetical protein